MQSNNGLAKVIIVLLAVVCIALACVFVVKNKPQCASKPEGDNEPDYSYTDDVSGSDISGTDIQFDDMNTEEMDSIPNEGTVSGTNAA